MQAREIPKEFVSGEEALQVRYVGSSHMAPYAYFLEGTQYGKPFLIALNRQGAKALLIALAEVMQ
jgi:hypothetical protein